jgi:hypothetical protein
MPWLGGGNKQKEWETAATHLYVLVREMGSHTENGCRWADREHRYCAGFTPAGSVSYEVKTNPYDPHHQVIQFQREGQGWVGMFMHRTLGLDYGPGEPWHLITVQADLLAGGDDSLVLKWKPNFKKCLMFEIYQRRNPIMALVSDWEAGKIPYAQFAIFR